MTAPALNARVAELTERVADLEAGGGSSGLATAGAGLTESPAGTVNAVANADGSMVVNANDIQVGVLATDAQHGNRGNGSLHSVATSSTAGFMSATDKAKVDGVFVYVPAAGSSATTIQAAIDSLNGYGTVFFEAGTYALGATGLNINGNVKLQGSGPGVNNTTTGTVITYTGTGAAITINSGTGVETLSAAVCDMCLDGTNSSSGGAVGIRLGQNSASPNTGAGFFNNLLIKRFSTAGVRFYVSVLTRFDSCRFESNKDGAWFDPTVDNGITTITMTGCRFYANTQRGVYLCSGDSINFYGCYFERNTRQGCLVEHQGTATTVMRLITFDNSYFELNNQAASTYPDLEWATTGSQSIQNGGVRRTRFQGTNTNGQISFTKGTFLEEDNEFNPVSTNCVKVSNSTVAFVRSRNARDPSTLYTAGANAPTEHDRTNGNGTFSKWFNVSGTITKRFEISGSATTLAGTVATSISGNAATATSATSATSATTAATLATPRTIDGVSFNGSADIQTGWGPDRKPASPHASNEEFEGTLSAWTQVGNWVATAIDAYATHSGANDVRSSLTDRPSWLMMQPSSAAGVSIHKAVTVPTDMFVWARVSVNHRNTGTITNNDHGLAVGLYQTSAGAPDANNFVRLWAMETDTNQKTIKWDKMVAGALTQASVNLTNTAISGVQVIGIQKLGSNWWFHVQDYSGSWFHLNTAAVSAAITPDRVALNVVNTTSTGPGCAILGVDFIRFSATSTLLP